MKGSARIGGRDWWDVEQREGTVDFESATPDARLHCNTIAHWSHINATGRYKKSVPQYLCGGVEGKGGWREEKGVATSLPLFCLHRWGTDVESDESD